MYLLYKFPGPNILEDGRGYDWAVFDSVEAGINAGWSESYDLARDKIPEDEPQRAKKKFGDAGGKAGKAEAWDTAKSNS